MSVQHTFKLSLLTINKAVSEVCLICSLVEIPGVARDSIRNEGTREINYGSCISASRPESLTLGERAPGTHWI
jgi:hypothetical protein